MASKPRWILLGLVIGCALATVLLRGEQTGGPQGEPVFRVTTRIVILNVVVHDKSGAAVKGLKGEDFTILDSGKKQKVAVFSVEAPTIVPPRPQPLPTGTFSNRVGDQGVVPTSVAVILLDALDTKIEDQVYARGQVIKFLAQLQPQDRAALYVLGEGLSVIQDFTSDPSPLVEAIRHYGTYVGPSLGSGEGTRAGGGLQGLSGAVGLARERLDAGLSSFPNLEVSGPGALHYRHIRIVLKAFEAIANRLSGVPGRRTIVWVTGGYPSDFTYLFTGTPVTPRMGTLGPVYQELQSTAQALNRANVAIYPVDARGLFTDPAFSATESRAPTLAGGVSAKLYGMEGTIMGLRYIASRTGGRAFCNTNDLKGALRKALDDSEVTYTLGYYPTHGQWNGSYHLIKVLVDRKGVEVRYRQGYSASADQAIEEKDRIALLREAAQNPIDATGVGLTLALNPHAGAAGAGLSVNLSIDVRDLTFRQDKGRWMASFDIWAGQYSNQGDALGGISKTASANLQENEYRKIMNAGVLDLTIDEKPETAASELRVVVRDASSGALGSVRVPLHDLLE